MASRSKICFIIGPMRDKEDENALKWLQRLKNTIIQPLLNDAGLKYTVRTPFEVDHPGRMMDTIISEIDRADVVIADLTGHNPNVFYELSLCHALGKPCVTIGDEPPFDIRGYLHVFLMQNTPYDQLPAGLRADLIRALKTADRQVDADEVPGNPITEFFGAPLTGVSATVAVADTYFRNFIAPLVEAIAEFDHEREVYRYGVSLIEQNESGQQTLRDLGRTRRERDRLKLNVIIPMEIGYCEQRQINKLRGTADGMLRSVQVSGPHRPFTINVLFEGQSYQLIDFPTPMLGLMPTIERRMRGLQINHGTPEWHMLMQEEIIRFTSALTRMINNSALSVRERIVPRRFDPEILTLSREQARSRAPELLWMYDILV